MKKLTILISSLLFANGVLSQEKVIKITKQSSKKEIIIKENKGIKIRTLDGQKFSGRFKIENNAILMENERIALSEIGAIKRHSFLISFLTSGFFFYAGSVTAGLGFLVGLFGHSSAFLLVIPAAAMIYAGIKSPNFARNFKSDRNWNFEIISTSQ